MKYFLAALALFVLLVPSTSFAAALYGDMSGTTTINVGGGADDSGDTPDDSDATGTPSQGSAGDDANTTTSGSGSVNLRTNALGIAITGSAQVTTDEDLQIYQENLRTEDSGFANADLDSDEDVDVAYWHEGKFLGLFPVKVESHTVVAMGSDGNVNVETHMPWWNFFVTGTGSVAADVDSELESSSMIENDFKMGGSAGAKARILEAVANAHASARAQ